jgi:hypothetical protein
MALEYGLYIQTDFQPKQVLQLMFRGIGIDAHIEKAKKRGVFFSTDAPGVMADAYRFKGKRTSYVAAEFGISASMLIGFRLDSLEDRQKQKQILLKATIELLHQITGDAVLLFNGEVVWLLRKAGELTLNSDTDLWRPEFLDLVTLPYKMKDFPIR